MLRRLAAATLGVGLAVVTTGCSQKNVVIADDAAAGGESAAAGAGGAAGSGGAGGHGAAGGSEPWVWVELDVSLPDGPAIDPKLDGDPSIRVAISSAEPLPTSCTVTVEALEPGGRIGVVADATAWVDGGIEVAWNGRDETGDPFDPGPVQLAADLYCTERMQGFGEVGAYVLRLGVVAVDFDGDTVPLAYHKVDLQEHGFTELGGAILEYLSDRTWALELADMDHDDASPRGPTPPWEDPDAVPWGHGSPATIGLGSHNVPVAYVAGGNMTLTATLGTTAVSTAQSVAIAADGPPAWADDAPEIRVVLPGYDPVGDATWEPGGSVVFESSAPLPDTVGRADVELSWGFEVFVEDQWLPIGGELQTTHRLYRVPGPSMVPDGTDYDASPAVAWVGVLEDTAAAVDGIAASDQHAIMAALRHHVYDDPWLIYDPSDSTYTVWSRWGIDLTAWLDRADGVRMWCYSTAFLLASLANHYGLPGRFVFVWPYGSTFRTRMTRAAGTTFWRAWTFGNHVVTRLGSSGLIWDCAVDVDGDADPDDTPCTPLSPVAVPEDEYLTMLTADGVWYGDSGFPYAW